MRCSQTEPSTLRTFPLHFILIHVVWSNYHRTMTRQRFFLIRNAPFETRIDKPVQSRPVSLEKMPMQSYCLEAHPRRFYRSFTELNFLWWWELINIWHFCEFYEETIASSRLQLHSRPLTQHDVSKPKTQNRNNLWPWNWWKLIEEIKEIVQ